MPFGLQRGVYLCSQLSTYLQERTIVILVNRKSNNEKQSQDNPLLSLPMSPMSLCVSAFVCVWTFFVDSFLGAGYKFICESHILAINAWVRMRKHFENGQDERNVVLKVIVWEVDDLGFQLHLPSNVHSPAFLFHELHQKRHCQFLFICYVWMLIQLNSSGFIFSLLVSL